MEPSAPWGGRGREGPPQGVARARWGGQKSGRMGRMRRRGWAAAVGVLAAAAALAAAPGGAWAGFGRGPEDLASECPKLKGRRCRRSMHCMWSGGSCAVAGDSGEAQCAAVQVKERRHHRKRSRKSRKRALCEMLQPAGGACVCSNQQGLCGTCTYQSNEPTPPGPVPVPAPVPAPGPGPGRGGEWIAAWATPFGDYNTLTGANVSCSNCEGCQGFQKVGKTPCVTAVGGASWGNPVCRKAGCYAIRCTGPKSVLPTCGNDQNAIIIVQVVDGCGCSPAGTSGQQVFDMNLQAFFEITQGGKGPIYIEYQEVSCDKMPPLGLDQSCKITV